MSSATEVRVTLRTRHGVKNPVRDSLAVVGSAHTLGCWKTDRAVRAQYKGGLAWEAVVRLPANQNVAWKWVVLDRYKNEVGMALLRTCTISFFIWC